MQQETQSAETGTLAVVGSEQPGLDANFSRLGDDALETTTPVALPVGELVRLDSANDLFLGEVTGCEQGPEGFFVTLRVTFSTTKAELKSLVQSCGLPCAN